MWNVWYFFVFVFASSNDRKTLPTVVSTKMHTVCRKCCRRQPAENEIKKNKHVLQDTSFSCLNKFRKFSSVHIIYSSFHHTFFVVVDLFILMAICETFVGFRIIWRIVIHKIFRRNGFFDAFWIVCYTIRSLLSCNMNSSRSIHFTSRCRRIFFSPFVHDYGLLSQTYNW